MSIICAFILFYFKLFGKRKRPNLNKRISNTLPSEEDPRDFRFIGSPNKKKVILKTPPIRNQGATNSCMSHAAVRAQEIQLMQEDRYLEGSELYHYYNARKDSGTLPKNVGMTVRQGCATSLKYGMALEKAWPWNPNKINTKPPLSAYWLSSIYKIEAYYRIQGTLSIKAALETGLPVVCGIWADSEYEKLDSENYIWKPNGEEKGSFGHAQVIIGFDDSTGRFIIENSWGTSWGKRGLYEISYDDFNKIGFDTFILKVEKWREN